MTHLQGITAAEALHLACQMERRALSLYERAALVFKMPAIQKVLAELIKQEEEHRTTFERLASQETPVPFERQNELLAQVGDLLFVGGLTGAVREGAFDSAVSLLRFALDEEERAALRYREFAKLTQGRVQETFLQIARQEDGHVKQLARELAREQEEHRG